MSDEPLGFRIDPALTRIDPGAFVARGAVVLGDVQLGPEASVWFGAIVRGDTEAIRIGARTNVQDGSVLHADAGFPCTLGDGVTVGHRCVVHGATIGDNCLLGMSATLMNGAVVGPDSIVGAGALVTEGRTIPPRSLAIGSPARVVRQLSDDEVAALRASAAHYVTAAHAFRAGGYDSNGGTAPSPTR